MDVAAGASIYTRTLRLYTRAPPLLLKCCRYDTYVTLFCLYTAAAARYRLFPEPVHLPTTTPAQPVPATLQPRLRATRVVPPRPRPLLALLFQVPHTFPS